MIKLSARIDTLQRNWVGIHGSKEIFQIFTCVQAPVLWKNWEDSQRSMYITSRARKAWAHLSENAHAVYTGCQH